MPVSPPSPCTWAGWPRCPNLVPSGGRCPDHQRQARRDSDHARGGAASRGYGRRHRQRFRAAVLARDPYCRCSETDHEHGAGSCPQPSTTADHWPRSRRQLATAGLDPDDPQYGRGLCKSCHDRATALHQPGGWHHPRR